MNTMSLPVFSATGSLETYIQAVNRFPLLTQEQETDYARRLRDTGDLEAARHLVLSHLRLVVSIARNYVGYGLPQADLIQEGNIGLMKAVKRFDPERKLFFNLRSMKQDLGTLGAEEVKRIARELGVKPEEVVEMETRLGGQDLALEPAGDDEREQFAPISYLAADHATPDVVLEVEQTARLRSEGLEKALTSLDPRSRRIIEARWLTENAAATLHDLATEFGVSAERIRQIEAKALEKMKTLIAI